MSWLDLHEGILEEFGQPYQHVAAKSAKHGVYRQGELSFAIAGVFDGTAFARRIRSHADSMRNYRAKLELSKICIVCASAPAKEGSKKCVDCRADVARYNTARHHSLKKAGKCASCNKPSDRPGKAYCSGCAKVRLDRWRARYSKAAKESRADA